MLFRVNGVSIDYLKMDYKRRLCLSCSPEAKHNGLESDVKWGYPIATTLIPEAAKHFQTSYNGKAMIGD